MLRGGVDRHLPALPAARRHAHFLQAQRHQPGCDILAAGNNGIVFAGVIELRGGLDPADQFIGLAGHGRNDDDHVIAALDLGLHLLRGLFDARQVSHRSAAEFHHQKRHGHPPTAPQFRACLMRGLGWAQGGCQG